MRARPLRVTAHAGSRSGTWCSWSSTSGRPAGSRCRSRASTPGIGLERLASVLQQVPSNFDTDLFTPIHARMRQLLGHDPDAFEAERFSYQVIADHSRAITFLIADGVLPSNEGRGYVLRRIVRRAVRHGRLLGRTEPFLAETAEVVIETMGEAYPVPASSGATAILAAIGPRGGPVRPDPRCRHDPPRGGADPADRRRAGGRAAGRGPARRRPGAGRRDGLPAARHLRFPGRPDGRAGGRVRRGRRPRRIRPGPGRAARPEPWRAQGRAGPSRRADGPLRRRWPGATATPSSWATRRRRPRAGSSRSCATASSTRRSNRSATPSSGPSPRPRPRSCSTGPRSTPRAAARSATRAVLRPTAAPSAGSPASFEVTDTQRPAGGLIVHRGRLHGRLAVGDGRDRRGRSGAASRHDAQPHRHPPPPPSPAQRGRRGCPAGRLAGHPRWPALRLPARSRR